MRPPLPIATMIDDSRAALALSKAELVRRLGYTNLSKGLRRLDEVYAGKLRHAEHILRGLPPVLSLVDGALEQALAETKDMLAAEVRRKVEEEHRAWRAAFRPHAVLRTERTLPQPIFVAAIIGVEKLLIIRFPEQMRPTEFAGFVKTQLPDRVHAFGRVTGFIVNFTPDDAVVFDLTGHPVERQPGAYRPGVARLTC